MKPKLTWLAITFCALAQKTPVDELIAAERAFSRRSTETTTNAAFLEVLPPNGILFREGPVPGRDWLAQKPIAEDLWLRWAPMVAEVSAAGDLGYTSGPYESGRRGQPIGGHGYFVSVWRKDDGGTWRLEVDLGIPSPNAIPVDSAAVILKAIKPAADMSSQRRASMADLDAAFRAPGDVIALYERLLTGDARAYRNGHEPASGPSAVLALLRADSISSWKAIGGGASRSGDLRYTYGSYSGKENGHYVRIWRLTPAGWRLVVDITNALAQ